MSLCNVLVLFCNIISCSKETTSYLLKKKGTCDFISTVIMIFMYFRQNGCLVVIYELCFICSSMVSEVCLFFVF